MDKRNPYYVIEASPERWGFIAGDYATRSDALKGLKAWRRANPDIPYTLYKCREQTHPIEKAEVAA